MRIKNFITLMCAFVLPMSSSAAINLMSLVRKAGPIDGHIASNLLSHCYMHNPMLLKQAAVNVDEIKQINGNTVFLCSIKHESLPTEYYIATIGNRHGLVVDGAMVGHNGDSQILAIEHPNGEMRYEPEADLKFDFNSDTIKVLRTYDFFSTARGGKTFEKHGTICKPFVINAEGKIEALKATATAIERTGDANYLSKNRKPTTTRNTSGEFFPLGMDVLNIAHQPANSNIDMNSLNNLAATMMKIIEQQGENAKENAETLSVVEFASYSFNLGMLHSNDYLTWIARNPKIEKLTYFVNVCASTDECGERQWLNDKIDNLKDKKARKWWQNWIKKNL